MTLLQTLFAAAIFCYLLSNFMDSVLLTWLISALSVLAVVFTVMRVGSLVRVLGSLFLLFGLALLLAGGAAWQDYVLSFGKMLNLLSLFSLIPILALPIRLGNYGRGVQQIIERKVKKSGHLYMLTSSLSYFLSSFMNLATIPMMYYAIRPSADLFPIKQKERFMSRSITQGFSMPILWAPVAPIVGIVIEMVGITWRSVLPILFTLSVCGLLLAWVTGVVIANRRQKEESFPSAEEWENVRREVASAQNGDSQNKPPGKLWHILLAIMIFNGLVTVLEHRFAVSFLVLITLLVLPFAFVWSLFIRETADFVKGLGGHFRSHLFKMKDQFFMFLSAGFFISALSVSGADQTVTSWMMTLKDGVGNHAFITLIPLIPFLLSFTGLHPAVSLALVAGVLDPRVLQISPNILAVAMLGGAVTSFLMGPYNATLGLMANIVKESPYRVSKWNAGFTLSYIAMIMLALIILQLILS